MKLGIHTCYFTSSSKIKPTKQCCTSAVTEYQILLLKPKKALLKQGENLISIKRPNDIVSLSCEIILPQHSEIW